MSNSLRFWGRAGFYVVLFIYGLKIIFMDFESNEIGGTFIHAINTGFHEAGHVAFRPLGRFMSVLGGTLAQLLMPFSLVLLFAYKNRDYLGASLALWWLGQSFMDCAPYINDALALRLPLVFGDVHDWNFLLNHMGIIRYYHGIATSFDWLGMIIMIAALVWGGFLLVIQSREIFH